MLRYECIAKVDGKRNKIMLTDENSISREGNIVSRKEGKGKNLKDVNKQPK